MSKQSRARGYRAAARLSTVLYSDIEATYALGDGRMLRRALLAAATGCASIAALAMHYGDDGVFTRAALDRARIAYLDAQALMVAPTSEPEGASVAVLDEAQPVAWPNPEPSVEAPPVTTVTKRSDDSGVSDIRQGDKVLGSIVALSKGWKAVTFDGVESKHARKADAVAHLESLG